MNSYFWSLVDKEFENAKLSADTKVEFAKRTIKHPHFKYAILNLETNKIIYKWKKPWKWFDKERIVRCLIKPVKIDLGEIKIYESN